MEDLRMLDDLERLGTRLARASTTDRVAAMRHLGHLLGGLDVVVVPRARAWHADGLEALYGAAMSRLQVAAICTDVAVRKSVLRVASHARDELALQIRRMEINAELDEIAVGPSRPDWRSGG